MTAGSLDQLCDELPAILTPDEVAQLLRLNKAVIYRWLESGYLPGSKLGKQWRILRADLRQLLVDESNQVSDPEDLPPASHTKNNEGDA